MERRTSLQRSPFRLEPRNETLVPNDSERNCIRAILHRNSCDNYADLC